MAYDGVDLDGYTIEGVLGRGGFATVYRARQLAVGREVALKVDGRVLDTPRDRQRFMREVTAAGQLSGHPHVVPVYDAGVLADNRPYMVLELCPGGSLGERIRREGPLSVKEARDIGVGIADAVAAAHAAGVLHRDIKPGNILVNRYGGVALADFGLAAMPRPDRELSVTREALTPAYAPPEAFHRADPTPAADVYSLAATLYALLLGRPPHHPEDGGQLSLAELIVRHTWPYPELPTVPTALNQVLRHALAADPTLRLSDAGALRDALAAVDVDADERPIGFGPAPSMNVRPEAAPPATALPAPPAATTVNSTKTRRTWLIAALAVVAVSVTVTVTVVVNQRGQSGDSASGTKSTPSSDSSATSASSADKANAAFGGVATTTDNCPAASVPDVGGRCVTTPECWSGITDISGNVTVSAADCHTKHVWETFAIAPLPSDGMTNNARDLIRHPDVKALCSQRIMAKSRTAAGTAAAAEWNVDIIPPSTTQWADGLRVFRCVAAATTDDGEITGNNFRSGG
ncbi:serine/threonine-protein kinase [Streptomyces sp. NPDC047072]|uniref:serine/threonine-protein kinase n=1 Tax=Streptomyces sp. NPDC047072 TaxID=3154809 RepID=UPI0033D2B474